MAAIAATLTGRVLVQFGDAEPVEVGTIEVPIHVDTRPLAAHRSREVASATVSIRPHRASGAHTEIDPDDVPAFRPPKAQAAE